MAETADVIVVGLGAMGAATAYQLAKRGVRVLGIDRYAPPHDLGSSHGETRITRQAVGEGEVYVPFALRSHEIWRELEAETGEELLLQCGFAAIDRSGGQAVIHGKTGFASRTVAAARRFGIPHELLTPDEFTYRHSAFMLTGDEQIYYEPGGGLVFPERCIAAQLQQARALGAVIRLEQPVLAITPSSAGTRIETASASFEADRVVVTAGGWTPGLIGPSLGRVQLLRQVLHWFTPAAPAVYASRRFPTFIWAHGLQPEDSFYGFPITPGTTQGVKLATEQFTSEIDMPEGLDRAVGADEVAAIHTRHSDGRLLGLAKSALRSTACFYTSAPDGDFAVDHQPENDRVLIVSACSGHGFKHSAGIGEHVAQVLAGEIGLRSEFALARPGLNSHLAGC